MCFGVSGKMMKLFFVLFFSVSACLAGAKNSNIVNLAKGKAYKLFPSPNYALCTGHSDSKDLTDGLLVEEDMWRSQRTVGWKVSAGPAYIDIDLENPAHIEAIRFHTTAGKSGTTWPDAIYVYGSNNRKEWVYLGDLLKKAIQDNPLPKVNPDGTDAIPYWIESGRWDKSHSWRYITLAVPASFFVFSDEIEILGRPAEEVPADKPLKNAIQGRENLQKYTNDLIISRYVGKRLRDDVKALKMLIPQTPKAEKYISLLSKLVQEIPMTDSAKFDSAILPLNPVHESILKVQAALWREMGYEELEVWKANRFDQISLIHLPKKGTPPSLSFRLPGDEEASDALFVSNASDAPMDVRITGDILPSIKLSASIWTDTKDGIPVSNALVPLEATDDGFHFRIPAGTTSRLWVAVNGKHFPVGESSGSLLIEHEGRSVRVPVNIEKLDIAPHPQELAVVLWDYASGEGMYGITKENRGPIIDMVRSRFHYIPWGPRAVLPRPKPSDFDENNQLIGIINFSQFDDWVEHIYPNEKLYGIFLIAEEEFAGKKMDSPDFEIRIRAWLKAFAAHLEKKGLSPKSIIFATVDESHSDETDLLTIAWTKAIKSASPDFKIFVDPVWERPDQIKYQESITTADIVCPRADIYQKGNKPVRDYFENRRLDGQTLWLYSCDGPTRATDAAKYYRKLAWLAWARNAKGIGFWALGGTHAWNEYNGSLPSYTPVFLTKDSVTNAIQLEAIAEGVRDYALLTQLRTLSMDTSKNPDLVVKAKDLSREIEDNIDSIALQTPKNIEQQIANGWESADARKLDNWRNRIIDLLREEIILLEK